uniref:Uncharacterized protein n=1 Tax=Chaetoceros debilis TaxID=122233 RepID=A0A6S8WJJ9_9STRA|mmetsp:Transcript_30296/g.46375  ORF Transcript_30296/g.46375 Transcript_30296/m.46375 type:complete len:180 (+) Transcript_30296:213-752(+)|eukprot:CAMPEP_0194082274 /NCGR_PEP_ID=MMETSP0149-20130528/7827_1 /TAXON_ID=122233 /ORGANISM="Chaetoceros debilis, Strain MM31A-1" /LENGTH=179 /DNA_ID=CAMNT_0038764385 /DNA_START=178 /DNA_END=717 /DNA_ORIENTATION=-
MTPTSKYGSVEAGDSDEEKKMQDSASDNAADKVLNRVVIDTGAGTYEEYDTQYVVTSAEESKRKLINACFPLLIFVILMGTVVYSLSKDFNHLYPGAKGDMPSDRRGNNQGVPTTTTPKSHQHVFDNYSGPISNAGEQKSSTTTNNGDADCTSNSKCAELELTGICCPTNEGVMLGCCN